ncbi:hypothetical protein JXR01_02420 [Candidatus Kaiserbacteria bacterium]|nr:MAG: hypothetical protein JXR01_02420 [Candidatus Kaiserbacteria bacterium]
METQEKEIIWVPEISEEALDELFRRIKPVIRIGDNLHRVKIKRENLRDTAYLWGAKLKWRRQKGLTVLCDINTFHYWTRPLFKPSVAEVLAQIPEEFLEKVVAFEIVALEPFNSELGKKAFNAGCATAITRLYVLT